MVSFKDLLLDVLIILFYINDLNKTILLKELIILPIHQDMYKTLAN